MGGKRDFGSRRFVRRTFVLFRKNLPLHSESRVNTIDIRIRFIIALGRDLTYSGGPMVPHISFKWLKPESLSFVVFSVASVISVFIDVIFTEIVRFRNNPST